MNKFFNKISFSLIVLFSLVPTLVFAAPIDRDGQYDDLCFKKNGTDCAGTVDLRWYVDENGNHVNCLSPGQCFGSSGNHSNTGNYEEKDMSHVLDNCLSAWAYKDGTQTSGVDAMYCGEAVIYQYSYDSNLASGLQVGSKEHVLAQAFALRMWEASVGANWNYTNGSVDGGVYRRIAEIIQADIKAGKNTSVNDPRIQAIVGGNETSMNIVNAAINYYRAAHVGGELNSTGASFDPNKTQISNKLELDSNIQNGAISNITLEDGTVLNGSTGKCSDGSDGCLTIDLESEEVKNAIKNLCPADGTKQTVKIKITYKSNDAVTSMKRYQAMDGNGAGCQQMISFDTEGEEVTQELDVPCRMSNPCEEDPETGKCYGPKGEEIDCDKMEEVCGPCIIEDGKCYRNEEEVSCDECDICVKVGDNCFVAGNQVDCEDYPECEDTCEKRGDKCYVGEKEVPCEDYPDCLGVCEREPGGGCTLGGEPVNCEDYEECKDFVCEKIGDVCFMGGKQVPCVYPPECQYDDPDTPDNCPIRKIDELPYYSCKSGDTEGELADPPMCSILKNNIRGAYKIDEYSDNPYCDVYCRETYSFKFMDKETAQSGRYFRHNVESKYVSISNLSTVVTATQQCTSLIDYDRWKKDYIAANKSVRNSFNTVKYWESLWELNGGDPTKIIECGGGATGCDNCKWEDACGNWQYIWTTGHYAATDAFAVPRQTTASEAPSGKAAQCPQNRCTGYTDGVCDGYICEGTSKGPATTADQEGYTKDYVRQQHRAAVNAYKGALDSRNSLISRIFNCNFFDDLEVKKYFKDPKTYFTSKYDSNHTVSSVESLTYHNVLRNYAPDANLIDLSYDDQGRLNEEGSASNVWFDKEVSPAIGTEGIAENKGYKVSAKSNDPEDSTVCGGCNDPIHDKLSDTPKSASADPDDPYGVLDGREYGFWVCYDSLTGAHCDWEADRLVVPYNYVANLEVTREIGYWQNTKFSTEIFTGKVVEGSGGLQLPEKSWPLAISTLTGDYNIFIKFGEFGDAKRKKGTLKLEFSDDVNCAYTVVNEMTKYDCDDGYHECYDCDDPSTPENECYPNGEDPNKNKLDLGFYFRSIDLDDIFPNSKYSPNQTLLNPNRPIGSNWNTQNAIQVINKIQDLGEGYLGGGREPEYSITLTPAMRKKVTKNNREIYKADYLTPSTLSCNHSTAICQSTWLRNDLRNILEDYNHGDYFVENDNSKNNLYVVGRNR